MEGEGEKYRETQVSRTGATCLMPLSLILFPPMSLVLFLPLCLILFPPLSLVLLPPMSLVLFPPLSLVLFPPMSLVRFPPLSLVLFPPPSFTLFPPLSLVLFPLGVDSKVPSVRIFWPTAVFNLRKITKGNINLRFAEDQKPKDIMTDGEKISRRFF